MTRNGIIVFSGTPGVTPSGTFYQATCPDSRSEEGSPTCIPVEKSDDPLYKALLERAKEIQVDEDGEEIAGDDPWMLHTWSVKDNPVSDQWRKALRTKKKNGWDDQHPVWRREYLGEWVGTEDGMVYAYLSQRKTGKVTWYPEYLKGNATGLPPEDGPWHLVMGIDFGYDPDPTAIVMLAYSERLSELRHIAEHKETHLLPDELADKIEWMITRYGRPERIVGDPNALGGKLFIEMLNQRHAIPVEKAETKDKNDHIELINGDFHAGRIKIIPGSQLDGELCSHEWDLTKDSKATLARTGKLKEGPKPNHLCDALLYAWRFCYHFFARRDSQGPSPGSTEYLLMKEAEAEAREASRTTSKRYSSDGYPGTGGRRVDLRTEAQWQSLPLRRPTN
jgi:hypothetical protein